MIDTATNTVTATTPVGNTPDLVLSTIAAGVDGKSGCVTRGQLLHVDVAAACAGFLRSFARSAPVTTW